MADWDENGPSDDDIVSQFPQNERAARSAVKTNFGVDHREENDANVGKHEIVQMLAQSTPTAVAGQGHFYTKDVGAGVIELFFQDAAGNETQLTTEGNISLSDLLIVTAKLADGVLSADGEGLDKMEDGYLSADTAGRAKMADGYTNTAKLADGALSADTAGRAKMADGFFNATSASRAKFGNGFFAADNESRQKFANGFVAQALMAIDSVYSTNLAHEITFHGITISSGEENTWAEKTITAPASGTFWRLIAVQIGEYPSSISINDAFVGVGLANNGTIAASGSATIVAKSSTSGTSAPIRALWLRVS